MSVSELSGGPGIYCGAAFFLWLAASIVGIFRRRYSGPALPILVITGSAFLLLGAFVCKNATINIPFPWFLGDDSFSFVVDPLSRWFLALIGLIGIPVALFSPGYLRHLRHRVSLGYVWAALALLMVSMTGVILAANALVFLVTWEVMALSSFVLVATDHEQRDIRRAAFVYLGATRAGTAFLMAGFLWAHHLTGSWTFSEWTLSGTSALGPALLILVGLATKAGPHQPRCRQ
jgi:formate hydrogenlyase subunit 3/multisubunit Na+/H+ antiporter MnhD subunit